MNTMLMTVGYLRAHARRVGRNVFRNEAGALSLEWLVIAVALVAAVATAATFFDKALKAEDGKLP
jgi:hypothetical protein